MGWQIGDLALCVKGGPHSMRSRALDGFPVCGRKYTVAAYGFDRFDNGAHPALWLTDGPRNADGNRVWGAYRFVKITLPEADAFDREVIELMTGKPAKVTA